MPEAKPPLSSFESAVPCKVGDTLTPEQRRRLFNGDTAAFAAHLASLTPLPTVNTTTTEAQTIYAEKRA